MQRYESYKPSGLDWLGDIPSGWSLLRAKYVFREINDRSVSGDEELLSVSHLTGVTPRSEKNVTMFMAEDYSGAKLCRTGDLVINTMWAWMGALGVSPMMGIVSPAYGVYRQSGNKLLPKYADWLLRTQQYIAEYTRRSTGVNSSRLRLYPDRFLDMPVLIPPIEDQHRIVSLLDQKTTEIDAAIAKKERLIELLQEKRKTQISKVVTKGLRLGVMLKSSGSLAIGSIPAHWEARRLKHATKRIYDCKNRTPDYFPDGEFFVVRTTNVKKGCLVMEGALYTDAKGFSEWTQKGLPKAGELVITREAPAGEVALLPAGFVGCLGQRTMGIVPDEQQVLGKFLLYFLQSDAFDQYVTRQGSGSTVTHLRVGQVFDIPLAFPPTTKEQQEIVDYLEEEGELTDSVVQQELRAIRSLRELKAVVIASTVSGQLRV